MAMYLAVSRPLRIVEEMDTLVSMPEVGNNVAGDLGDPIANDQHFDVGDRLRKGTSDREVQRSAVAICRNNDGRGQRHPITEGSPSPANRLIWLIA
jgi:hypothetical protein